MGGGVRRLRCCVWAGCVGCVGCWLSVSWPPGAWRAVSAAKDSKDTWADCDALCCRAVPRAAIQHEFSVFWVPRRSIAVERVLEDEGVYGEVTQVGVVCVGVGGGGVLAQGRGSTVCLWKEGPGGALSSGGRQQGTWGEAAPVPCWGVAAATRLQVCRCGLWYMHTSCCAVLCCVVRQGEFPLDLVPVDDDVLSLELDGAFRWGCAVEDTLRCRGQTAGLGRRQHNLCVLVAYACMLRGWTGTDTLSWARHSSHWHACGAKLDGCVVLLWLTAAAVTLSRGALTGTLCLMATPPRCSWQPVAS